MIINQNVTVETFSYIFRDAGIFVFENAASGTVTIIAVVRQSQTCSNSVDGIGASMVTREALAEIGVQAYNKEIDPNWSFVIGSFIIINLVVYGIIACFVLAQRLQAEQKTLF